MSVKHLFKTTEIILLEERSNFDRKTNIGAQNSYYSYAERKTYRRENSKRDLKLFPTTSTPKQILRQISRGRNRPSKEAELGSQISGYKFAMDFKVSTYYLTRCSISIRNKWCHLPRCSKQFLSSTINSRPLCHLQLFSKWLNNLQMLVNMLNCNIQSNDNRNWTRLLILHHSRHNTWCRHLPRCRI